MVEQSPDSLREAAPAYNDLEAKRARAGVAAALFAGLADDDEPQARLKLGRYEIESRLGAGGMGVVYRAHDPDLERPVAVKLLHADSSTDDKARARMQREARALAKLAHPNVITVYDVGTEDGQMFVAMELVAGRDLRRWLEDHADAAWRSVLGLFIAAGRGLEAAHEVGLIHRDFKPENVLVGDDGRVRVLDFGLARVHQPIDLPEHRVTENDRERTPSPSAARTDGDGLAPGREGSGSGRDRSPKTAPGREVPAGTLAGARNIAQLPTAAFSGGLTETGALLGTPLYMAPELYTGQPADERSDQFAFCASLYEGVYRQLPFGSLNLPAHVKAVTEGRLVAPPVNTQVPAVLESIIAKGLDPDAQARYLDMATLLAELDHIVQAPPPIVTPEPAGSLRWLGITAVVAVLAIGFVGLELGWLSDKSPAQASVAAPPRQPDPAESTPSPAVKDVVPPDLVELTADPQDPTTGSDDTPADTTGPTETPEAEVTPPTGPNPELHGWCHLHEDRYTLLSRTNSRRGSFTHQGTCYTCRVERRRSRTSSFSPRDCGGYSLCGEASADACE